MKNTTDKKHQDLEFHMGDQVFLKLHPHRQQSISSRVNQKLAARFYDPF